MTEPSQAPIERRPIKSRDTKWAERATTVLVKSGVSPNTISLFGMFAAIAAGLSFGFTSAASDFAARSLWLLGGLLCQIRLLCNLFDGMVAVDRQTASAQGELYNEVPDRVSDAAVMIGLGYSASGNIAAGYVAGMVSIFVAYIRATGKSIGAPNDFCGPMAKPQRMALATALAVYMAFSPASWRITGGEATLVLVIIIVGGLATAWRRLARAAKFLKRREE